MQILILLQIIPSLILRPTKMITCGLQDSTMAPQNITSTAALLEIFEKSVNDGKAALETAREEQLAELWTLRNGETIYSTSSKAEVIRMSFSQIIHHRAQLGVYLRLLNIPIPGSYGPSADDMSF